MKKIGTLLLLALAPAVKGAAQEIRFAAEEINYGRVEKGSEPFREFRFTNTGNGPLVIMNAVSSCGCVTVSFPKEPVMPGASDRIVVRYDTQRVGAFTKYVTVTSNSKAKETVRLKIYGEVDERRTGTLQDLLTK
jgi:hypothetical protein